MERSLGLAADRSGGQCRESRPRDRDVLEVPPAPEIGGRIDGPVLAHVAVDGRVDLEVQMEGRRDRVTGVADETEHLAGLHMRCV
ncbi:MAG TPA: hypothetical protein VNN79_01525, partial [Actinomycetota bacterium]|nr:hypothetical protein [Actinomycetota bacterium]